MDASRKITEHSELTDLKQATAGLLLCRVLREIIYFITHKAMTTFDLL